MKSTQKILISLLSVGALYTIILFITPSDKTFFNLITVISIILFIILFFSFKIKRDDKYWTNLSILVGFGVTIIGWFLNSYFENINEINRDKINNENQIRNTRRQLRIQNLLTAYSRIENINARHINDSVGERDLSEYIYGKYAESALGQINLLADSTTIRIANDFIMNKKRTTKPILIALRNELRRELGLPAVPADSLYDIYSFRFFRTNKENMGGMSLEQELNLTIKLNELNNTK